MIHPRPITCDTPGCGNSNTLVPHADRMRMPVGWASISIIVVEGDDEQSRTVRETCDVCTRRVLQLLGPGRHE